jgi:hypothetical protein
MVEFKILQTARWQEGIVADVGTRAPGLFINIFQLAISPEEGRFMARAGMGTAKLSDLRKKHVTLGSRLRLHYSQAAQTLFGYGADQSLLSEDGFEEVHVPLRTVADLGRRALLDGFADQLGAKGFKVERSMGRFTFIPSSPHWVSPDSRVQLFKGYDVNSLIWSEPGTSETSFGFIVDVKWVTRDGQGAALHPGAVGKLGLTMDVGRAQGEFLPGSARINTEVARLRLEEGILPFVSAHREFGLPSGVQVTMDTAPLRVVLGG